MALVSMSKIYSVLSPCDRCLAKFALTVAFIAGAVLPLQSIVSGEIIAVFFAVKSPEESEEKLKDILPLLCGIAGGIFATSTIYYGIIQVISHKVTLVLRGKYLRALIKQEVGYFEKNNVE